MTNVKPQFAQIFQYEWRKKFRPLIREMGHQAVLMYLYLRSCSHRNMSGIYYLPLSMVAHELSLDIDVVENLMSGFVSRGDCMYDYETEEVFILDMLVTQVGDYMHPQDKRAKMVLRHLCELESISLHEAFEKQFSGTHLFEPDELRGS